MLDWIMLWLARRRGLSVIPTVDLEHIREDASIAWYFAEEMIDYIEKSGHLLTVTQRRPKAVIKLVRTAEDLKHTLDRIAVCN